VERAITKDLGKERATILEDSRAPDIVGKTIKVKFDDTGLFKTSDLSNERGEKVHFMKVKSKNLIKKIVRSIKCTSHMIRKHYGLILPRKMRGTLLPHGFGSEIPR
jgi:hypothetical protein